jgi:hypothetical protein
MLDKAGNAHLAKWVAHGAYLDNSRQNKNILFNILQVKILMIS